MKDATEIVCVIDKSGSMNVMKQDAIGGFNSFLEEQQKLPGEANLTVVMFDTSYEVWPTKPVADHEKLSEANYMPGGNTALLDAVGKAVNELNGRLLKMDDEERPDKAIFVIITDGQENSSREFRQDVIKKMIEDASADKGWEFLFLGANVDAFEEGGQLGIRSANIAAYSYSAQGMGSAFAGTSNAVASYRGGGSKKLRKSSWKKGIV